MPELPPHKRRPLSRQDSTWKPSCPQPVSLGYAELHCRTNYSFLEGASHPDELVTRAAEIGLSALAITDRNSVAGVVRAHVAAKAAKLKLLIGAEITPADAPPVLLWSMNRAGYGRLCRLISRGRQQAPKGDCRLTFADVAKHAEGLLARVVLNQIEQQLDARPLARYRDLFGNRTYALAELHRGPSDQQVLANWQHLARQASVPLIAANDVHCHFRERQQLQDVLTAIRHGCTVAELGERRFPNAERHLKSAAEMAALFVECPDAVARAIEVIGHCNFSLDELRYDYPEELCPRGLTPIQHLINLTWCGAKNRYPRGVPDKVRGLIEHELKLIDELHCHSALQNQPLDRQI